MRITGREFRDLRALVYRETGIALGDHKRELVCSRLARRLRAHRYATFSEYYRHLTESDLDGHELHCMVNAITTSKTEFFREEHHSAFLASEVVPGLAASHQGTRRLRIWSAGCSSGEEPYSIALTIVEGLPNAWAWDVRILASDINYEAGPFHALLVDLARGGGEVVVDVSTCSGIDSSAVQLLLAFREALEARGGRLSFAPGAGPVGRLLAQVGLR